MKCRAFPQLRLTSPYIFPFLLMTVIMFSLTFVLQSSQAQQVQLTLADILTGLRSKKVSIIDRNKLLTDAVRKRGITFALTAEIEKELEMTGADKELIEAIKEKSPAVKETPAPTPVAKPVANPVPTPTPQVLDIVFYQNRANSRFVKGDYDLAIVDYNKVIELNAKDASNYFTRGMAYQNRKSFNSAIADYDKVIELDPQEVKAYLNRADIYERTGNSRKAIADYQKTLELDANNEEAKNGLKRLHTELEKILAETKKPEPVAVVPAPPKANPLQPAELGQLNSLAVSLIAPAYPEVARKSNIQGKVTVQVSLNEEGKVVSAKATSGPQMLRMASEDAARRTKFKPAVIDSTAVKANGFIVYNFVNKP